MNDCSVKFPDIPVVPCQNVSKRVASAAITDESVNGCCVNTGKITQ